MYFGVNRKKAKVQNWDVRWTRACKGEREW